MHVYVFVDPCKCIESFFSVFSFTLNLFRIKVYAYMDMDISPGVRHVEP